MADDSGRLNQVFAETSFLYGANAVFIEMNWGFSTALLAVGVIYVIAAGTLRTRAAIV